MIVVGVAQIVVPGNEEVTVSVQVDVKYCVVGGRVYVDASQVVPQPEPPYDGGELEEDHESSPPYPPGP